MIPSFDSSSTACRVLAILCFVAVIPGCAAFMPVVQASPSAGGDGAVAGEMVDADQAADNLDAVGGAAAIELDGAGACHVPGYLRDFQAIDSGRRMFEIPTGFVRGSSHGTVTPRRDAIEFEYVPRQIDCAAAWSVAETVGREFNIDPAILFGVMRVESSFTVNVVSYAGAVGLMQIMPASANGLECGDLLDPVENARCGARILTRFLKRFDNNLILGLSAYNAGFGMPRTAVKKSRVPRNFDYPEKVLRVRAKYLRWRCAPWE